MKLAQVAAAMVMVSGVACAQECWLLRHGEPGTDGSLTDAGRAQATAAAATWSASAAQVVVLSSPVARCRQTAEIVAKTLGRPAPTVVPWLSENAAPPADLPAGAILVLVTHAPVIYRWAQARGAVVDRAGYATPIRLP